MGEPSRPIEHSTMGCTSSTEVVNDPITGEGKKKKKLGGAYPAQRRPQKNPYVPDESEFNKVDGTTSTATAHFVACGGGNALVLMNKPNRPPPDAVGAEKKEYISVTLPPDVNPGDVIHVQAPDGRLNAIIVPEGMGPGSTFTVEFDSGARPPPPPPTPTVPVQTATAVAAPTNSTTTGYYDPDIPVAAASPYPSAPVYPTNNSAIRT